MQVASTEWFLGVQIQNFENLYNAEIILGGYCCCDTVSICVESIVYLQGMYLTHSCEPYFLIHIEDKSYQLNYERNASILDHAVLAIPFKEKEWSDHVRTKIG